MFLQHNVLVLAFITSIMHTHIFKVSITMQILRCIDALCYLTQQTPLPRVGYSPRAIDINKIMLYSSMR